LNRGTAEHRSEESCFVSFKNFCGSKFLVQYPIFKKTISSMIIIEIGWKNALVQPCFFDGMNKIDTIMIMIGLTKFGLII